MNSIITGITGMDGSILCRDLLAKGHTVYGIIRRSSTFNTDRIDDLMKSDVYNNKLFLKYGDLTDSSNLCRIISEVQPDYFYNLGAMSHVKVSYEIPEYTADVDALGVLRVLDALKSESPHTRFYQASTSEQFGGVGSEMPDDGFNEESNFHPRSPYGVAKLYGYWITKNYRESYNLFASNGILFNHESSVRGETFVTRKITMWFAKHFTTKIPDKLILGNLNAYRDWGHAEDFVKAMQLIIEHDKPDDFVIATGETHTVREFIQECCDYLKYDLKWEGSGEDEKGFINGVELINISSKYFRPAEVDILLGNSSKARRDLGWVHAHTFKSLIQDMLQSDINRLCDGL